MGRRAIKIEISRGDKSQLQRWANSRTISVQQRERAVMVLESALGTPVPIQCQSAPKGSSNPKDSFGKESLGPSGWGGVPWTLGKASLRKNKLVQSKAETPIIESQNGRVRHYLARFKRKTLCYSKSVAMANLTLLLFFECVLIHLSFKDKP